MNTGNINELLLRDFLPFENKNFEIFMELIRTLNIELELRDFLRKDYKSRISQPIEINIYDENFSPKNIGKFFINISISMFRSAAKKAEPDAKVEVENWLKRLNSFSDNNIEITLNYIRDNFENK
jgi:predicted component of type VI protein secretion system